MSQTMWGCRTTVLCVTEEPDTKSRGSVWCCTISWSSCSISHAAQSSRQNRFAWNITGVSASRRESLCDCVLKMCLMSLETTKLPMIFCHSLSSGQLRANSWQIVVGLLIDPIKNDGWKKKNLFVDGTKDHILWKSLKTKTVVKNSGIKVQVNIQLTNHHVVHNMHCLTWHAAG